MGPQRRALRRHRVIAPVVSSFSVKQTQPQRTGQLVSVLHCVIQCIQKFFSQILFDFKRMVSHSISPNFQERFLISSASPEFVFLGSKDKTVLFSFSVKQTQPQRTGQLVSVLHCVIHVQCFTTRLVDLQIG